MKAQADPANQDLGFETDQDPDQLASARGIIVWVFISATFWILFGLALFL